MPNTAVNDPATILARSVRLKLFVVLRRTRDPERLKEMVSEHLNWMVSQERNGRVFLSGPIATRGAHLDGLTVVRGESLSEAEKLIQGDPLVAQGLVEVEIGEWTVNEGSIPLLLTLSDSTVNFR